PTPASAAVITPEAYGTQQIAVVNGQALTIADIDPATRQEVEGLGSKIATARREVFEILVNTALLNAEGKKRKLTPQQLYELAVVKKLTDPIEPEVGVFIAPIRAQLGEKDPTCLRAELSVLLHAHTSSQLTVD